MKYLKYLLIKKKTYLLITIIAFLIGFILILISFEENIVASGIWASIGTSLIAGCIVSFLDFWRVYEQDELQDNIHNVLFDIGITHVYKKRDLDKYDELINQATEMIDVTGYSLRGFFQSYRSEIINKIEKNPNFKLRILLVDPRSIFSKEKEKEENGEYRGVFHANICTLYGYFKNYSSNIEIKLIPSGLSSMIFRIDDKMFIGPYMYKRDSKSTVTFEVTVEGWMFRQYTEEFEILWNAAEKVNKEIIEKLEEDQCSHREM